jgi:glycosyltransferase A (GT-A) superfamily protein (DUF2064 family)
VDSSRRPRENQLVPEPGESRQQIVGTLNAAYATGLLSRDTFVRRLDHVLKSRLIDPRDLVADLNLRAPRRGLRTRLAGILVGASRGAWGLIAHRREQLVFLALDWSGKQQELLIGRHDCCDVVLQDESVSRLHARLVARDGGWVLQDLESTNGTLLNGVRVGRCELRPGDRLLVGTSLLQVD